MKRVLSVLLALSITLGSFFLFGCRQEISGDFAVPEGYTLEFADEFKKDYDDSMWAPSDITIRRGGYWDEEQLFIEDGNLIIRTEYKEDEEKPGYYTGALYWPTKRITYGYFEIRCKVENTRGLWNAFWLMPDNITNTEQKAQDGSEIDIFESAIPNRIQNAIYYDNYKGRSKKTTDLVGLYDVYHTYALDWKKDSMKFYFDGGLLWEITDPDLISAYPAYLNLTTEINGRVKDGVPTPDPFFWIGCGNITDKDNDIPSDFVIDYVRIYDNGDLVWSGE